MAEHVTLIPILGLSEPLCLALRKVSPMHLISLLIACSLFAQESINARSAGRQDASTESPAAEPTPGGGSEAASVGANAPRSVRVVPVRPDSRQVTPEELVAQAILSTAMDEIPGEPLSLLSALSNVRGQAERIGVVHAYWRSTLALAEYGVALDENRQLRELNSGTALATSASRVETARLAAIEAQRRLAQTARLPRSIQLPMPSDRPHVRAYKTRFEEIFSSSVPMERMWLIDRKLPLRLQVINVRASAVQAAEDALDALTTDSYRAKESDPTSVTAAVEELARQRRAYLEAVCDYNYEIADYALSIAGQEITGRQLVATLIVVDRNAPVVEPRQGGATEIRRPSDVQRAEFLAPLDEEEWEPTPAIDEPPRTISSPAAKDETHPTLPHRPRETTRGETGSNPEETSARVPARKTAQPPSRSVEYGQTEGSHSPMTSLGGSTTAGSPSSARLPLVPVERTVFKLPADEELSAPQYADLVGAESAIQAGRLVTDLFPNLEGTVDDCQLVDLRDCLADRSVEGCRKVINAYWLARLRACEYQAFAGCAEHLGKLVPIALGRSLEPSGTEDVLRLRVTRLSSDADAVEAHARLLDALYELTLATERPLDSSWLLPRTSPRCGHYPLRLDAQPRSLAESWPVRRLAVTIPMLSEAVMSRATAVVVADTDRSNAMGQFADGTGSVDAAMDKIKEQSEHALAFLDTVTAYNQSIAEYVVRTGSGGNDVAERVLEPANSVQP